MKRLVVLAVVAVFTLVAVSAVACEGEATDYFVVSSGATQVLSDGPECGCVTVDCQTDYFRTPATATDVTNWPESDAAENAA